MADTQLAAAHRQGAAVAGIPHVAADRQEAAAVADTRRPAAVAEGAPGPETKMAGLLHTPPIRTRLLRQE